MFQSLFMKIVLGCVRHALTVSGGALVTDGYLSADDTSQAIGAIMTVLGIAWSAWEKYKTHDSAPLIPIESNPLPPLK